MDGVDYSWKNTDPRHSINKHSAIVIVREGPPVGEAPTCMAMVETNHGYYIHTGFDKPYHRVGEGDDWPEDWKWTWAPRDS